MECKTRPQVAAPAAADTIEKMEESKFECEDDERFDDMEH
jgi:hypothetical protein